MAWTPTSTCAIAEIAEAHHGVFALITFASSRSTETRAQRTGSTTGRWESPYDGVYRIAGAPRTWRGRPARGVLGRRHRAVASHRSAAALWDLPGERREIARDHVSPLAACTARRARRARDRCARATAMSPSIDGIPVTTVERTIFDLAAVVQPIHGRPRDRQRAAPDAHDTRRARRDASACRTTRREGHPTASRAPARGSRCRATHRPRANGSRCSCASSASTVSRA